MDENKKFEISIDAAKEIIRKIVEDIPDVKMAPGRSVNAQFKDGVLVASLRVSVARSSRPLTEVGLELQKNIIVVFEKSTGIELKNLDIEFDSYTAG